MPALISGGPTFVDEVGSPFPPGIKVSIWTANDQGIPQALVAQGYTTYGGVVAAELPPTMAQNYIAYFVGAQAPKNPVAFLSTPGSLPAWYDAQFTYDVGYYYDGGEGGGQITVIGYRSPCLSPAQYAAAGGLLQPLGWYSNAAINPGGVLYALMAGLTAGIAAEDLNAQAILETLRLWSCVGGEIDSWAFDMVGPLFQRFPGEPDSIFIQRIQLMIGRPRCTINALQSIVSAFYDYVSQLPAPPTGGQLSYDNGGGYNTGGAYNTNPPPYQPFAPGTAIFVWDGMTQPGLAAIFGVKATQFVVQIGAQVVSQAQLLAFNVTGGFNVSGAFDMAPTDQVLPGTSPIPPDARLGDLIQIITKAAGTQPLFIYGPSLQE